MAKTLSFFKINSAPSSYIDGAVYFDETNHLIYVGNQDGTATCFSGVQDASFNTTSKVITITKPDGTSLEIDLGISNIQSALSTVVSVLGATANDGLRKRVSDAEGEIDTLQTSMTSAESSISALETAVGDSDSGLVHDLSELESKVETLETNAITEVPVEGIKSGESIISLDGKNITSTLSISYDSTNKQIKLLGIGNAQIGDAVDCSDFVKDGILTSAEIVTVANGKEGTEDSTLSDGKYFKFTWNTDADLDPVYVPMSDFAVDSYTAGSDLKLDSNSFSVSLGEDISVTGVTVGNLKDGDTIAAGKTLSEILKLILMKRIGVTATNASIGISGVSAGSYEYGALIPAKTIATTLTDGKYTGQAGYSYNLNAGCTKSNDSIVITGDNAGTYDSPKELAAFNITQETTFKAVANISAGTNTPVDNMGDEISTGLIAARTGVASGVVKYSVYANWFVLHDAGTAEINSALIRAGKSSKESIKTLNYNAPAGTVRTILALRKGVLSISSITGNLGAGITSSFVKQTNSLSVEGATAEWSADYDIYIYTRAAGLSEAETINITLS